MLLYIYITICSYVYIRNKVNHFTICIDKAVTVDCTKALAPAELRAISVAASIRLQFRNVFTCSDLATGSLYVDSYI